MLYYNTTSILVLYASAKKCTTTVDERTQPNNQRGRRHWLVKFFFNKNIIIIFFVKVLFNHQQVCVCVCLFCVNVLYLKKKASSLVLQLESFESMVSEALCNLSFVSKVPFWIFFAPS